MTHSLINIFFAASSREGNIQMENLP